MKIAHIILSTLTVLLIFTGIYFFTDLFGDREARKATEEDVVETPEKSMHIRSSTPQGVNDPDGGVLINDKNIQIERKDAPSIPNETGAVYVERNTDAEVRTTNESTSVSGDERTGYSETVEDDETDVLEMNIPPVPDM
jgi:hypothetical protein